MHPLDNKHIDWTEIVEAMRVARDSARGYADYWDWQPDRKVAERQVAAVLFSYLEKKDRFQPKSLRSVANDPPDVEITTGDNRKIGVEVTELVDSEAVKAHRHFGKAGNHNSYDWADWSVDRVASEISKRIAKKDRKLAAATTEFDELIIAIVTDEPMIDVSINVKHIDRAYLILSYSPAADMSVYPDGCPILQISLMS